MKPKYRRIAKTIPAIITLVMASAAISNAAIVTDDGTGNYTITATVDADNSGPNTVLASGGTSLNPFVDVLAGASITGDAGEASVIEISDDNYTVNNSGEIAASAGKDGIVVLFGSDGTVINNLAGGIISSVDGDAIDIQTDGATVNNSGTIEGGNDNFWDHGIQAEDDFTLVNSGDILTTLNGGNAVDVQDDANITNLAGGVISGQIFGIDAGDGLTVSNDGLIEGILGEAIVAGNDADITNLAGGTILGDFDGINVDDDLTLSNAGLIEGFFGNGIVADDDADITNLAGGTITGALNGIDALDRLTLSNDGLIEGIADDGILADNDAIITNLAGGTITGGDDGIDVADRLSLSNAGEITGFGSDGVDAGNEASIANLLGGTITGDDDGVDAGENLILANDGLIEGIFGDGINAGLDADITNNATGTIIGLDDGIEVGDFATISNAGTITGTGLGFSYGINAGDDLTLDNLAGGQITGDDDGVNAVDDLLLTNAHTITGVTGDGVDTDDNANITNLAGGVISGGDDGIDADDDLVLDNQFGATITGGDNGVEVDDRALITNAGTIIGVNNGIIADDFADITNSGTITGTNADGIRVEDDSVVNNSGTITGDTGIDAFTFGTFTLNNTGTITATGLANEAIDGALGVDTINLNPGSVINGDIVLKGGDDNVFMTSDAFSSTVVNGNINGGFGTDTLTFNGGRTSPFSTENIVHGDVTFMQDIIKEGGGVAMIGDITDPLYFVQTDEININGGGLYINADIDGALNPQTQINSNLGAAALGGTGTWDANIAINSGGFSAGSIPINLDVNPVNAVGTVTVNGNVDHAAGTFIRFDVVPGTVINDGVNSDLIVQTGGGFYDVDGANVRISPTSNNTPITAGTYTVVTTDGNVTGIPGPLGVQFNDNVNSLDGGFQGTLTGFTGQNVTNALLVTDFSTLSIVPNGGGGEDIQLTIARDFDTLAGLSGNSLSFATALDASLNVPDANLQDFIAALDYSTLADVQDIFAELTTLDSFSTAAAITSSNYHLHRVVQDHLAVTRSQVGTISRTYVGTYAETTTESAPAPAPALGNRFNAWGSFSYDWKDSSGFASDIDGEEASFVAGLDYRIAPSFLLGILLQGSTADYDFSGGGSDVDSFRAAIYGTYGEATGFYADFLVGYGDHDFDSKRRSFLGTVNTDTDAESLQAMLTVGYAMQSGGVKHGPWGGVEYSKVDVDGYTQGGFLPFGVDDYDVESTRLLIGYRLEAEAGRFTPYLSVAYAHELDDGNQGSTGVLPGGATFGIDGGRLDSAVLISAGTGYSITESLGLNVGYHGEIATDDGIDSHGGTIGLNYAF